MARQNWFLKQWKGVIFSDESLFSFFFNNWSSLSLATAEKSVSSRLPSVNCEKWRGFCDNLERYFLEIRMANDFLHGRINKRHYLQMLSDQVHPMAQSLFPEENSFFSK